MTRKTNMKSVTITHNGVEFQVTPQEKKRLQKQGTIYYCRDCRAYHSNEDLYFIKHDGLVDGEQLYWSMQDGWSGVGGASVFTAKNLNFNLPLNGKWEKLD